MDRIEDILVYMLDHHKHFETLPLDIEIGEHVYDLGSVIEALMQLGEEQ